METDVLSNIQAERGRLEKKREVLLTAFSKAAASGRQKRLSDLFIKIRQTNDFLKSLDEIEKATAAPKTGNRRYAVSSLFLHESFKKLTADRDEEFFFITGNEVGGAFVLDQWAEFAHQKRSVIRERNGN